MKATGKCPKCGSTDLIIIPGKMTPAGSGRYVMTGNTTLSAALLHRYVCASCGYTEEYFDKEDIEKLKHKFSNK